MTRRSLYEPGPAHPAGEHTCVHDAGITGNPPCGKPGVIHFWGRTENGERANWVSITCEDHTPVALTIAWDWHPLTGVCAIPGTLWVTKHHPGEGTCIWPDGERAIAEHEAAKANA